MKTLAIRRPMSSRGQVVIPKDIRGFLGLQASGTVVFEVRDSEVVLKAPTDQAGFLDDFLGTPKCRKPLSTRQIKSMLLDQYEHKVR
jgi:AbrB family looped-hinge helix DNA binding protein